MYKVETKHHYWRIELSRGEYSDRQDEVLVFCADSEEEARMYFLEIAKETDFGLEYSSRGHLHLEGMRDDEGECKVCAEYIWDEWRYGVKPLDVIYHSNRT